MQMATKILIVVTNHGNLGDTDKKTGWYLPEVAHPYHVFKEAGYDVTFVSPKGGRSPMATVKFTEMTTYVNGSEVGQVHELDNTLSPYQINISEYRAIVYAGGHGPMWDVAENIELAQMCTNLYENGGLVAAVCHGAAGLINVKLSNGQNIVKGRTITSFTNSEEAAIALTDVMPFLLETRLKELGANFIADDDFKRNVQLDHRLITGQNPASSKRMAKKLVEILKYS
ncbi:hypothetical protein FSP39_004252 [Pinctada imbricata]|uniref:DJ-1/PfpI domain-containing protein n=1 Tax=Pinctada imbricata TaxID=66713 RepID=A0AA88XPS2_PINIB|nr:hypothetical protein FSP39_004252 [Pinctada imbricata]